MYLMLLVRHGSGAVVLRHEIDRGEGQAKKDENRKDERAEGQNKEVKKRQLLAQQL